MFDSFLVKATIKVYNSKSEMARFQLHVHDLTKKQKVGKQGKHTVINNDTMIEPYANNKNKRNIFNLNDTQIIC